MSGYLYCMTNPFIPNVCKIGYTKQTPHSRSISLSNTSVPDDFIVHYAMYINGDVVKCEKVLFKILEMHGFERINPRREFFKGTPDNIKNLFSTDLLIKYNDTGKNIVLQNTKELIEYNEFNGYNEIENNTIQLSLPISTDVINYDVNFLKNATYNILNIFKGSLYYSLNNKQIYYKRDLCWKTVDNIFCPFVTFNMILIPDQLQDYMFKTRKTISKKIFETIINSTEFHIPNFEETVYSSTESKLCFKNGIFNFDTKQFHSWTDDVYTMIVINRDFNITNIYYEKKHLYELLVDQYDEPQVKILLTSLARIIAGKKDNRWIIIYGSSSSGKGLLLDLLRATFGYDYIPKTFIDDFKYMCKHIKELDKWWLYSLRFSRLIISENLPNMKILDGRIINEICSDKVTVQRSPRHNITSFPYQGSVIVTTTEKIQMIRYDTDTKRLIIKMPYKYVPENKIVDCTTKLEIFSLRKKIRENNKYLDAFLGLIIDHYVDNIPNLDDVGDRFMDSPDDAVKKILDFFIIDTSDSSLFLLKKELFDSFKTIRQVLSISESDQKMISILTGEGASDWRKSQGRGYRYIKFKEDML
jgi:hypothetical protein